MKSNEKIKIAVSSCLLGQEVRYDGGHKRDRVITDTLSEYFEYLPYCPEVAIGLGTPRPSIRLEGNEHNPRAVIPDLDNKDVTEQLKNYGHEITSHPISISGYIFKSKSPSCGIEGVKLYSDKAYPETKASGIYASEIMKAMPLLPVEEEDNLHDLGLRDNFIERVFFYYRWQYMIHNGLTISSLMNYHTEHKSQIMNRDKQLMQKLGLLVAKAKGDLENTANRYIELLMQITKNERLLKEKEIKDHE